VNETVTAPAADKTALRSELEATHAAFRELIAQLPDAKWNVKSGNAAFTCGQLAWHITSGVDFSAEIIEDARKGKQTSVPAFLMPLGYKLNEIRIRRRSRAATRDSVLADYDREQARLLRLLDEVSDAELAIVKTNFAITQSVREMFNVPIEHFAEHAPEIRKAL
jgi:DinB family protein